MATKKYNNNGERVLESRVTTIEANMDSFRNELAQVSTGLKDLITNVAKRNDAAEDQFQKLMVQISEAKAPKRIDWMAIIGTGVSVFLLLITIGALVLQPLYKDMNRMAENDKSYSDSVAIMTKRFHDELHVHETLTLHPVGQQIVTALDKKITELDIKLQREFALMADTLREKSASSDRAIAELDNRLQREFLTAYGALKDTAEALKEQTINQHNAIDARIDRIQSGIEKDREAAALELQQRRLRDTDPLLKK